MLYKIQHAISGVVLHGTRPGWLKAILISLCNVSEVACTNFKMIMMSTSFFLKPPRRGDVGRLEPFIIGYEDHKVTR